jgi:hypothetical protein
VIAEQMGCTLAGALDLLAVYGHGDAGALEEIDRAFKTNVTPCGPSTQIQLRPRNPVQTGS